MKKLLAIMAATTWTAATTTSITAWTSTDDFGNSIKDLPDTDFTLETIVRTVEKNKTATIKITNWKKLNNESKPLKFEYDKENVIEITVDEEGKLIITPLTNENPETVMVTVSSEVTSQKIKIYANATKNPKKLILDEIAIDTKNTHLDPAEWIILDEKKKI